MKKIFQTIAWLTMLSVCLIGCGKQESDRLPDVGRNTDTSCGVSEKETANSCETSNIQHVSQELCDNLYIDASAVIPDKNQYSTYTLKMVDCDPERL